MSIPKPLTQSLSEAILSVMGRNGRVKESEEGATDSHLNRVKDLIDDDNQKHLDEAVNPWKRYEKLEDNNDHSGNVIHMAKHVGTPDDVKKAIAIKARHMKEGSMYGENQIDREALSVKLWPKFRAQFEPKNESVDEDINEVSPHTAHEILTDVGGHGKDYFELPLDKVSDLESHRKKQKYNGNNSLG